jgi:hypothetical protein
MWSLSYADHRNYAFMRACPPKNPIPGKQSKEPLRLKARPSPTAIGTKWKEGQERDILGAYYNKLSTID